MVQLGDEHGGHAVERGRPLRLGRLEDGGRIEALARVDHGGPVAHAAEIAHDHAEAVIERHGDEEPVAVREAEQLRREVAVVQNIVMAEGGALRVAGGAARVLDIDRVVELLLALAPRQVLGADRRRLRQELGPGEHAGRARLAEPDHAAQIGQCLGLELARAARAELRRQLVNHAGIVGGLELRRDHEPRAAGLAERVLHLVQPIARVDIDEDRADLARGELRDGPLGAVRRPHADPLALLDPEGHEGPGTAVDLALELAIAVPESLLAADERLVVGIPGGGLVEQIADREAEERQLARPARIALLVLRHVPHSSRMKCPPSACWHTALPTAPGQAPAVDFNATRTARP